MQRKASVEIRRLCPEPLKALTFEDRLVVGVAISFALVGAIVGEFVAGSYRIGFQILLAQGQFDTVRVFVSLLLLGLVGPSLFFLVDYAERLLLPWHISQRARSDRSAERA
jgi:NitT/TauT family transport system permease protein